MIDTPCAKAQHGMSSAAAERRSLNAQERRLRRQAGKPSDEKSSSAVTAMLTEGKQREFATLANSKSCVQFSAGEGNESDLGQPRRHSDRDDLSTSEPRRMLQDECRSLDDWRKEVGASHAAAINQPGWHLDRSPTGSGKTHATITALRQASSSLTVLPTHANVTERVAEMRRLGVAVEAYPELTPDNCQNYDQASQAQSLGFGVTAAVCPSCPHQEGCSFLARLRTASVAPHRLATHERLRRSNAIAGRAQVIVVDECPEAVVAPTLVVPVSQLIPVQTLAMTVQHPGSQAAAPQKAFAERMLEMVTAIFDTCRAITGPGVVPVDLRMVGRETPKDWQRLFCDAIGQIVIGQELRAEAISLVTKAVVGELVSLAIVTDLTPKGQLHHYITGSWKPALPENAAVIMLDATGNAADIEAATGASVTDCTPVGYLQPLHPITQLVDDITRRTSASTVAGFIEAFLDHNPTVQRLGIIGHQPHIAALIDNGGLGSVARSRIAKWCYFGQGPDRASNDWHQTCDHLLVLGTPRANPGDHRRWLLKHGRSHAAERCDGDWGPRTWQSYTTGGAPITVSGTGYRDPDWNRAYIATSGAMLHQAIGRGRSILPDGISVTVISSDPTPYPAAQPLKTKPKAERHTVAVVQALISQPPRRGKNPIDDLYRGISPNGSVKTAQVLEALAAAGVTSEAAKKRLAQCKASGTLIQVSRGRWTVPGTISEPIEATASMSPALNRNNDVASGTIRF